MSGMIKYGFYFFRTLLSWVHPPAMCCCATARPQLGRQRIPKHEMSSLKKQGPPMSSQRLVGRLRAYHNSRGSSCPDIRTVSHLPAWARYGRSAVAAPSETCTKPFPTSQVFKTSCPSITGKSSTTDRRSSSCKTCCTASETPTSWTSKWARARSWSRKWKTALRDKTCTSRWDRDLVKLSSRLLRSMPIMINVLKQFFFFIFSSRWSPWIPMHRMPKNASCKRSQNYDTCSSEKNRVQRAVMVLGLKLWR